MTQDLKTEYLLVRDPDTPAAQQALMRAASRIREGGLVVFPTETVYGLAANAFDYYHRASGYPHFGNASSFLRPIQPC